MLKVRKDVDNEKINVLSRLIHFSWQGLLLINTTVVVSKTFVEMYEFNYVQEKINIPNKTSTLYAKYQLNI